MDAPVLVDADDALTLGDGPGGCKGGAVLNAAQDGGEAGAVLGVQADGLGVPHAQLGALLQAGDHGDVIRAGHKDGVTGAVERLRLDRGDLIGRQHLEIQGVGDVGER